MAPESQLAHRNVKHANLPYVSFISPTATDPCFIPGSQDVMTSIAGYSERRPGFSDTDATGFTNLKRVFTWDRNDGSFYKMYCDLNASNQAVVYKQSVLTDVSPVSIYTDTASSTPFDFVVSNNTVYFSNGHVAQKWDPVNGISNWGIAIGSVNNVTGPSIAGAGANQGGTGISWTNPNNVTSAVSFATVTVAGAANQSKYLAASTFGFSIPATNTILGIAVTFDAQVSTASATVAIALEKLGALVGSTKQQTITSSLTTYTLGGSSDLWGTTWTANDLNQATFGATLKGVILFGGPSTTYSIRNVNVTVYGLGGPTVTTNGSGSLNAYVGYQYVFCYGNSNTGHVSSPTPVSGSTGPFGGAISTTTLAGSGSGYAANDTGIVVTGNQAATYQILTVSGGAVLTYSITANGKSYVVGNNVATAKGGAQPGAGTGFTINITAIGGIANTVVSLTASTDSQVNQIRVFRSTDSVIPGTVAGTFFEIPNSPFANTTTTINDTAADNALLTYSVAPLPGFNDPPTPFRGPVYYSGRIWGFADNKVYFSALEENTIGVPEESFVSGVAGNFWNFDEPTQGLAVAGSANSQTLGIFCGGRLYGIVGNSLDTFRKFLISNRRGCRNVTAIATLGSMVAWFDSSGQVWGTDGTSLEELGLPIRPDLAGLNPANVSMTFHASGKLHWLLVSTGTQVFTYDLDTEQWMPPWSFVSSYLFSGETSAGNYLLFGAKPTKSLTLSATAHNDNGSAYQPIFRTNLFSVVPDFGTRFSSVSVGMYDEPSRTGLPWIFQVDTNSAALSDVSFVADEDPLNGSTAYTSIFGNQTTPERAFNRRGGSFLLQNVFPMTQPTARWIGLQWKGQIADDNLRVYGFYLAYSQKR